MSKAEIDRFNNDVQTNKQLQEEVKAKGKSVRSLLDVAKAQGYDITIDDVRAYLRSQGKELDEKQLDAVSGGAAARDPSDWPLPVVIVFVW